MKRFLTMAYGVAVFGLALNLLAESKIRLDGTKTRVISADTRETVIDVGEKHVSRGDPEAIAQLEQVDNPFFFEEAATEEAVVEKEAEEGGEEPVPAEPVVVYDDAAVLEEISVRFQRQIRGTIQRGDTRYLQIRGGSLLRKGSRFSARIPEIKDESFGIVVTEIGEDGCRIQLNATSRYVPYSDQSPSENSSIRRDNP